MMAVAPTGVVVAATTARFLIEHRSRLPGPWQQPVHHHQVRVVAAARQLAALHRLRAKAGGLLQLAACAIARRGWDTQPCAPTSYLTYFPAIIT